MIEDIISKLKKESTLSIANSFFLKIGPFPASFFFIFDFSIKLIVYINFTDDWIWTANLWCRKRPLYQLRHNHFPSWQILFWQNSRLRTDSNQKRVHQNKDNSSCNLLGLLATKKEWTLLKRIMLIWQVDLTQKNVSAGKSF